MIDAMPRPRPPHLQRERTRHGKIVWFVRIGKGPRTRLKSPFGTPEFDAEYIAAINGEPAPGASPRIATTSLQWLWDSYRETGAWQTEIRQSTRRQRENIMRHVLGESGSKPFAAIKSEHIEAGLDRRSKTPAAARNFLNTMQGLFRWAKKRGHVKIDPTASVEPPKRKDGAGFPEWTGDDVDAYQRRWPIGTRQRIWLDVLLYTGLRRGDVVKVGRQHAKNGIVKLRTEKSGETITVTLPILPVLQLTLDAGPIGDMAWICGARGGPFAKESFGNEFSQAARQAGVKKSAHGVRKICAIKAAENGATERELDALFGWVGGGMAAHYTREANRAKLAAGAINKLDGNGTSPPAPLDQVRASAEKT